MGSVKDLTVLEGPSPTKCGRGRFIFSDRYSVFDWGEMPDHIDGKGAALCITSAYFFERLSEEGIESHYLGVVEDGRARKLSELKGPQSTMEIRLVRVVRPNIKKQNDYDYAPFRAERINFLIPLEIIYRNSLPEGSSVFRRLKDGSLSLADIGMDKMPESGERLSAPLFDVSTKLESSDRYLGWEEAGRISGLSSEEVGSLRKKVFKINDVITREAGRVGLVNEDGKVEFGFDEVRRIILLDTVGTLDECRFTLDGNPVSKELLRRFYRGTEWHEEVEAAKKTGSGWKDKVRSRPEPLDKEVLKKISLLYKAACNEITGREWFAKVPPLKEILGACLKD
jgi:phosphoribosylaminoimidazole-succinocarboxamide synthase